MVDDALLAMSPNDDLRRLFAAYRASLTPNAEAMAVLRAGLVARAAARAAEDATRSKRAVPRRTRSPLAASGERRLAAGLLAAGIGTAAIVGGAAAAQPGAPLYEPRLWAEALTLPGEPAARVEADLLRLDARLADARRAAAARDPDGARAAFDAFGAVVDDALARAGSDVDRERDVADGLERRRDALAALRPEVASSTADATLRGLIDRTNAAIAELGGDDERGRGGPPDANPGNAGNGGRNAVGDGEQGRGGSEGNDASARPSPGSDDDAHRPSVRPSPSHPEPSHAEPSHAEPSHAEPSHADPSLPGRPDENPH